MSSPCFFRVSVPDERRPDVKVLMTVLAIRVTHRRRGMVLGARAATVAHRGDGRGTGSRDRRLHDQSVRHEKPRVQSPPDSHLARHSRPPVAAPSRVSPPRMPGDVGGPPDVTLVAAFRACGRAGSGHPVEAREEPDRSAPATATGAATRRAFRSCQGGGGRCGSCRSWST